MMKARLGSRPKDGNLAVCTYNWPNECCYSKYNIIVEMMGKADVMVELVNLLHKLS